MNASGFSRHHHQKLQRLRNRDRVKIATYKQPFVHTFMIVHFSKHTTSLILPCFTLTDCIQTGICELVDGSFPVDSILVFDFNHSTHLKAKHICRALISPYMYLIVFFFVPPLDAIESCCTQTLHKYITVLLTAPVP